ncbi:MAG TPA: hypothetical protein VMW53_02485 [archaeon]|nr:hypothetical protein [Bacteroidales bacterium]HUV81932.1 hypothetical protein [archaeon]
MESTKVIRWKKVGGGSIRGTFNGVKQIIKPGQIFLARPSEISANFRDVVIPQESIPGDVSTLGAIMPEIKAVAVEYKLKPRENGIKLEQRGKGPWYNVLDPDDKVLNEKALKKDAAVQLIEDLTLYDVVDSNGKALNEKALKKDAAEKLIQDLAE